MSIEEFHRWSAAQDAAAAVHEAGAEEGGPRVSLVPDPRSVPLDILPDEVEVPAPVPAPGDPVPFKPEPSRKTGGWSAVRQRLFIENLAETGSVHMAAYSAGLSARSAYGLRVRSRPFARLGCGAALAVGDFGAAFEGDPRPRRAVLEGQLVAKSACEHGC